MGKTTLASNIASYLATENGQRVLIIDLDPQCNTTQLILPENLQEKIFSDAKGKGTIMEVVEPLRLGETAIAKSLPIVGPNDNGFKVGLIPGHPSLSLFEDFLSSAWLEMQGARPAGLRQSLWIRQLISSVNQDYDIAILDIGPSFGALNRTVLLGGDYFVSPLGCDLFSIIGIENIGKWLDENNDKLKFGIERIVAEHGADTLAKYISNAEDLGFANIIGYTVMQYITKSKGGERRPTEAFERFRRRIPETVEKTLKNHVAANLNQRQLDLGDVPNMYSIVPLAQYAQKPVHLLTGADGLAGAAFAQHKGYVSFITNLANNLFNNLKLAR